MANIAFFMENLKSHIYRRHITHPELNSIRGIVILNEEIDLKQGYIYIADSAIWSHWLRTTAYAPNTTIFLSDDSYLLDPLFKKKDLNIVTTDFDILTLYNHLNTTLMSYHNWSWHLINSICNGHSLQETIATASNLMKGHIFLLNLGYRVLAASDKSWFDDPYADEFYKQGYASFDTVDMFSKALGNASIFSGNISRIPLPETGHLYYVKYITIKNRLAGILLFIINDSHRNMDIFDMIHGLGNIISNHLADTNDAHLTRNDTFRVLLSDFSEKKMLSDAEIDNRFRLLPSPVDKYIYCIIIECDMPDTPYEYLISELKHLIPGINITVWKEQLVILYSRHDHKKHIQDFLDIDALNHLLEHYHGKAIVSAATHRYAMFKTLYLLSQRLLTILKKMNMNSAYGHIYQYRDYTIYLSIDFSTQYYQTFTGHSDIIYLADPAVITLSRYDITHKSQLRDVLYYYLKNGCNVAKTAQTLYMHRNTVLNKLNKIQELVHLELEDGSIQQQLMFSCQLVKYYTDVLNLELAL